MHYDFENDKLVSMDNDMEIYPINPEGQTFKGAKIIDIEIGDNHIRDVCRIASHIQRWWVRPNMPLL